jgi:hypothetical protein
MDISSLLFSNPGLFISKYMNASWVQETRQHLPKVTTMEALLGHIPGLRSPYHRHQECGSSDRLYLYLYHMDKPIRPSRGMQIFL